MFTNRLYSYRGGGTGCALCSGPRRPIFVWKALRVRMLPWQCDVRTQEAELRQQMFAVALALSLWRCVCDSKRRALPTAVLVEPSSGSRRTHLYPRALRVRIFPWRCTPQSQLAELHQQSWDCTSQAQEAELHRRTLRLRSWLCASQPPWASSADFATSVVIVLCNPGRLHQQIFVTAVVVPIAALSFSRGHRRPSFARSHWHLLPHIVRDALLRNVLGLFVQFALSDTVSGAEVSLHTRYAQSLGLPQQ